MISAAIACIFKSFSVGPDLRDAGFPLLAAALALCVCSTGAQACDGLADGPSGRVVAVPDGNTLELDSGIVVSLAGTRAPLPAGRRPGSIGEPLAAAATTALAALVLGKQVRLGLDEEETDRYGRMEAQVYIDEPAGSWIEGELLARGMGEVASAGPNRRCLPELLAVERLARANRLGIWGDPYYSVREAGDPTELDGLAGRYELVEGKVLDVGKTRDRIYLDFGPVWKTDFTAVIDRKAQQAFASAGVDPLSFKGQRVRIRGWLEDRDGPLVELGSPAQIEVLGTQ
jgi:micrococcal nuclease